MWPGRGRSTARGGWGAAACRRADRWPARPARGSAASSWGTYCAGRPGGAWRDGLGWRAEPPNGGLTMAARGPGSIRRGVGSASVVGLLIPGAHHRSVFPARWLGHGAPFRCRGSVTPVLRQPLPFGSTCFEGDRRVLRAVAPGSMAHERFDISISAIGVILFIGNSLSAVSFLVVVPLSRCFGLIDTMVYTHLPSNVLLLLVPFEPRSGSPSPCCCRATRSPRWTYRSAPPMSWPSCLRRRARRPPA